MEEILNKIDVLIKAHEQLVNGLDGDVQISNYNKIAKLNQVKQLINEYNNMK